MDLIERLAGSEGTRLFAELAAHEPSTTLATAERLRGAGWPAELVAAAMTQRRLRERARADLGGRADRMFFTDAGLQQASRWVVAVEHARRFTAAGVGAVADLGCGIGVDSIALADAGLSVLAVERDPVTVAVARANLAGYPAARVVEADLTGLAPSLLTDGIGAAFLDPARRTATGRRILDPRLASPPLSFIEELAQRLPGVGAKVAPGIDHDLVPESAEAQWISVRGEVVEAGLWFGAVRKAHRRSALLIRDGRQVQVVADGAVQPVPGEVGEYLIEPDGAVIRAGAIGVVAAEVDGRLLDPSIAYLTCDAPVEPGPQATAFRVLDVLPFSLKGLRGYLRQRQVGVLTIKKRGTAVDPATLRRQLRLRGPQEATIVLTRVAGRQSVLVVEPLG